MNPFRTPPPQKQRPPGSQQTRAALDCAKIRSRRSKSFPKETASSPQAVFREKRRASLQGGSAEPTGVRAAEAKAGRRRAYRSSPRFQQHDEPSDAAPVPGRTPAEAGAASSAAPERRLQPQRQDDRLLSEAGAPKRRRKKTGRSGKRSIPRMKNN